MLKLRSIAGSGAGKACSAMGAMGAGITPADVGTDAGADTGVVDFSARVSC